MKQILPLVIVCCVGIVFCIGVLVSVVVKNLQNRNFSQHKRRRREQIEIDEDTLTIYLGKK